MKKIPVFTSILLIAGVLATMGFSHPLVVRNGIVRGASQNGGSLDIINHGLVDDFVLRQGATILPSGSTLAVGDHVTVFADCFHSGLANRNAPATTSANNTNNGTTAATATTTNTANTNAGRSHSRESNDHVCIALAVLVRKGTATAASGGAVPATGGTATGTSAPSTSGATGSSTPAASASPAASATSAASATPMVCPTSTPTMMAGTGTPAATSTPVMGTATATATSMAPCVTPTP